MRNAIIGLAVAAGLDAAAVDVAGPVCAAERDIGGRRTMEGFSLIVELRPCAGTSGDLCGRIVPPALACRGRGGFYSAAMLTGRAERSRKLISWRYLMPSSAMSSPTIFSPSDFSSSMST